MNSRLFLPMVVGIALACTVVPALAGGPLYSDVSDDHDNARAIAQLRTWDIMTGNPDGTFAPDRTLNRAEFMRILAGTGLDSPGAQDDVSCFPDVHAGAWYAPAVCKGKAMGWAKGYPDGLFHPEQEVNVAEAITLLVRVRGYPIQRFSQASPSEQWYQPFVETAMQRDIYSGGSSFSPHIEEALSRGNAAEMLYRDLFSQGQISFYATSHTCDSSADLRTARLRTTISKWYPDSTVQMRQDLVAKDAGGRECEIDDINPFQGIGRDWRFELGGVWPHSDSLSNASDGEDIPVVNGKVFLRGICECDGGSPHSLWELHLGDGELVQLGTNDPILVSPGERTFVFLSADRQELTAFDAVSRSTKTIVRLVRPLTLASERGEFAGALVPGAMTLKGSTLTYSVYDSRPRDIENESDIGPYKFVEQKSVELSSLFR